MEHINFVITNWTMIVTLICVAILAVQRIVEFCGLPTEKKKEEIRNRLLEWVRSAESELGGETGKFKLAQVYDIFCKNYPELQKWYTLEKFEALVKESLDIMGEQFENETVKVNALGLKV